MEEGTLDDSAAVVTKINPDKIKPTDVKRCLGVRISEGHHEKLAMLVRETGRSRRDILEMLIDMAKVGQYSE
tara:strand:+ start:76 stop:291 length:216 start_codon:yes stop_codon:yes gene_type:complete